MDERPKEADVKVEPAQEYYPGTTWNFQEIGGKLPGRHRVSLEAVKRRKVSSKMEDDTKSVLVVALVGNKDGCQTLVEGFKRGINERDKMASLGIEIGRDLEIGPTSPSKQPCTNPNPAQFSFEGAKLVSTPIDPSKIAKFKNLPY